MSSHTPGPWRVNEDNEQIGDVCAGDTPVAQAQMCGTLGKPNHEERRANARLIAAAPELLDALMTVLESAHPDPDQHPTMTRAWKIGRAAIAKATTPQ